MRHQAKRKQTRKHLMNSKQAKTAQKLVVKQMRKSFSLISSNIFSFTLGLHIALIFKYEVYLHLF